MPTTIRLTPTYHIIKTQIPTTPILPRPMHHPLFLQPHLTQLPPLHHNSDTLTFKNIRLKSHRKSSHNIHPEQQNSPPKKKKKKKNNLSIHTYPLPHKQTLTPHRHLPYPHHYHPSPKRCPRSLHETHLKHSKHHTINNSKTRS